MDAEERLFIKILKDFLHSQETKIDNLSSFDLEKLYNLSAKHQLSPIVYWQIHKLTELVSQFKLDFYRQVYLYQTRTNTDHEAEVALADFDYAFFKGRVIAEKYPEPNMRTMVDTDILVKEKDLDKISKRLELAGFEIVERYKEVLMCSKHALTYEIHTSLIENKPERLKYVKYFDDVWSHYKEGHVLEKNFHFVYVFMHLRDHFIGCGVGFRQFMDIAVLTLNENYDWDYIAKELDKLGLLDFAKKVLYLNKVWFDVDSPFPTCCVDDEFVSQATELIINHGVFGSVSREEDGFWISKYATEAGVEHREARILVFFRSLFPAYQTLTSLPYCRYVIGKKYLIPIAWLHRAIIRIPKHAHREAFVHRVFCKNEKITDRIDTMRKWGLHK